VLVAVGCGVGAVYADAGGETAQATVEIQSPITPVLSARRVPDHITEDIADRRLAAALTDVLDAAPADTCLVVDAGGRPIIAHRSSTALIPASNEKVLVAAAALDELGPRFRYTTTVQAGAAPNGQGVVNGDLWLVGGGDPVLATRRYSRSSERQGQAHTSLETLADRVAAAGVTEVRGRVLGDESRYDTTRYVDAWPSRFIDQNQTGPLSALSVNDGYTDFQVVELDDLNMPAGDPAAHAAEVFEGLLAQRGVRVTGGAGTGTAPQRGPVIAEVRSAPIRDILAQFLTWSENQTAEMVLKEVGFSRSGQGSTASGAAAVEEILTEAGFDLTASDVVDGSGLAGSNRVTCGLLHAVLADAGVGSPLVRGLAVAGRSGTLGELATQFAELPDFAGTPIEGRLRAKTGSLNEVRALSGVVVVPEADDLTFSLLVNEDYITAAGDRVRYDAALAMANYPQRPNLAQVAPRPLDRPASPPAPDTDG
jgi:D-alanyl-D-alanine carboxypeptidase/D-alanyl-D-alanine-endopeptidase (penicillin-binding protein 4)